jgi:hypothetical protein
MIYGCFNDWMPQPMIPISQVSLALDVHQKANILQMMKDQRKCRDEVDHEKYLSTDERRLYLDLCEAYRKRFINDKDYQKTISRLVQYREPHITCIKHLKEITP